MLICAPVPGSRGISHALLLLTALVWIAGNGHRTLAGGVVTTCTEAELRAALAGGGPVTFACDGTITLTNTLVITNAATIDGTGHSIVLSGGGRVRVLEVHGGLELRRLTIADGYHNLENRFCLGGGIYSDGDLRATDCTFSNNVAEPVFFGSGGAIYSLGDAEALHLNRCLFVNNTGNFGGAVAVNPAGSPGWTVDVQMINCTFAANQGPAVALQGGSGGGGEAAPLWFYNCTFVGNSNSPAFALDLSPPVVAIFNSILTGNVGLSNPEQVVDGGHNLCSDASVVFNHPTSMNNTEPMLGPLGDYGGPTWTIPLLPGSPALEAGDDSTCPSTDQRSVARPLGERSDIGAFEGVLDPTRPSTVRLSSAQYTATRDQGIARVQVLRSGTSGGGASVTFRAEAGTAVDGVDFASTNTTLVFADGVMEETVCVALLDPPGSGGDRTVLLSLEDATGTVLDAPSVAVLTLQGSESAQVLTNCSEAGLRAAVGQGGLIRFGCDGTITLTQTLVITNNTTIEANGRSVTISGGGAVRVFEVRFGGSLSLRGVTVAGGRAQGRATSPGLNGEDGEGGGIYCSGALLTLADCTFTNNAAVGGDAAAALYAGSGGAARGGAVCVRGGMVSATRCLFVGNLASGGRGGESAEGPLDSAVGGDAFGGAICGAASLHLEQCTFRSNRAVGGLNGRLAQALGTRPGQAFGGAVWQGGDSDMVECRLENNSAASGQPDYPWCGAASAAGGALYQHSGVLTITSSVFATNSCAGGRGAKSQGGTGAGGAIYNAASLALRNCQLRGNMTQGGPGQNGADGFGGAFCNAGSAEVRATVFAANAVTGGDGANGYAPGRGFGGALWNTNVLILFESSFLSNDVTSPAGQGPRGWPAFGGAIGNRGLLSATNNTFYANTARGGSVWLSRTDFVGGEAFGGALYSDGGAVILNHQSLALNAAVGGEAPGGTGGLGCGGGIFSTNGTVTLQNCLLANSPSGGNVVGTMIDAGNNLSSDATPLFTVPDSHNNTDLKLAPFGDHGGPTPTIPPFEDSPAIDAGNPTFCPAADQRGVVRPNGAGCDIGACEGGVLRPPELTLAFSPGVIVTGSASVLTYTVRNPNVSAMSQVSFTNRLPAGLGVADPPGIVNDGATGTVIAEGGSRDVLVTGVLLTNRQTCHLSVGVIGQTPGLFTNVAGPISAAEGIASAVQPSAVLALIARPSVVTGGAGDVQEHSVRLTGTADPNGSGTSVWFEYGATHALGSQTPAFDLPGDYAVLRVSDLVSHLPGGVTCHYRLVARNDAGISYGLEQTVPLLTLSRTNFAVQFDGLNDYVTVPQGGGLSGRSEGTIELWVQWNGVQPEEPQYALYGAVLCRSGTFGLQDILALDHRHPAFAKILWSPYGPPGAVLGTTPVGDGVWRHVAVTFRPGDHRLYLDGVWQGTGTASGALDNDPASVLRFGSLSVSSNRFAGCVVDEVRIWAQVRTAEEILSDMKRPLDSGTPGLIAYWRLDEGTGTVAHDATGAGYDGTLVNGPTWTLAGAPLRYRPLPGAIAVDSSGPDLVFTFAGSAGQAVRWLASTNLTDWQPVFTNLVGPDGLAEYLDGNATRQSSHFIRTVTP